MQNLFSEFKATTAADWKNQLIKDLKGEPYESLLWHNENGFDIKPFYTSEDLQQDYEPAFTHADWEICVRGKSNDPEALNKQLLRNLEQGATSLALHIDDNTDLETALKGIQLNYIQSVFFVNGTAAGLKAYFEKNYDPAAPGCSLFPQRLNTKQDLEKWHKDISVFNEFENIKTVSVNALDFHNKNCLAYYEVAIIIAALTEHLEFLSQGKQIPKSKIAVQTGVSSDYFIQIAKLRAIRRLWKILSKEYSVAGELYLIVETSLTNKSISDGYNNLLRTTVEAMAAVSGGCNELIVTEFDVLFNGKRNLSERMAINQQLILKDESYLDKMADMACGSFYIESITDAIAGKALEAFKRFENEGGYFKCIEKNIFSAEIEAQAKAQESLVEERKKIAIGVNKFKNEKEQINIPSPAIAALKKLPIHNPVLNFELENYFKQS